MLIDFGVTLVAQKLDPSAMGLGRKEQDRSRAAYLAHRYASNRKPMPGALVKLRPGHQRQDLLTKESFTAACRRQGKGCFNAN